MRSSFSGFYGVTEETIAEVFTSDKTIFIFDTNILLTLYRCEEDTRNRFLEIWEIIKEKCWFPHHVCLEYQRNRLAVVNDSRESLSKIPKKMNSSVGDLKNIIFGNDFNQTLSRYSNLREEIKDFFSEVEKLVESFDEKNIKRRKSNIDFLVSHDVIRDRIDILTNGRIGPPPTEQKIIDELNKVGAVRYAHKIGPGYDDAKVKEKEFFSYNGINYQSQYGDFYVWNQILELVKERAGSNIIYVTNDAKSDFFFKVGSKVRGPNESLITEIKKYGASEFLLQNIDTFLHHANSYLNASIEDAAITELSNASTLKNHNSLKKMNKIKFKYATKDDNFDSKLSRALKLDNIEEAFHLSQYKLNSLNFTLKQINSVLSEVLPQNEYDTAVAIKDNIIDEIDHLKVTIDLLTEKILLAQESDSIANLRNNLSNYSDNNK